MKKQIPYILIFLFAIIVSSCSNDVKMGEDHVDQRLVIQKNKIDDAIKSGVFYTEILAKQAGKDALEIVKNDNWPDQVESVYNIWRNEQNAIRLIAESQLHANEGMNIVYETYFDGDNKTFVFVKTFEYFNSKCSNDPVYERRISYYNKDFELCGKAVRVLDQNNNILNYDICKSSNPPEMKPLIFGSVEQYLKHINSQLE